MIHPRLFELLGNHYPGRCTIQTSTEIEDAAGQPIPAWSDLAGHIDLQCRVAPSGGSERKATNQVYSVSTHVVELAGWYPQISSKMRVVADDGLVLDILLPEHDGNHATTRLVCQVVK